MTKQTQYKSQNFQFLQAVDPLLVELGARAERYALKDPNTAMIKSRQLGELLAQLTASKFGVRVGEGKDQRTLIDDLFRARALPPEIKDYFHTVRMEGNQANHAMQGDQGRAITLLRHVRKIAVWYFRTHHNSSQKLGPFQPPQANSDTGAEARAEIERLEELNRQEIIARKKHVDQAADEAILRELAEEELRQAHEDMRAAIELAEEIEASSKARQEQDKERINELTIRINTQAEAYSFDSAANEKLIQRSDDVAAHEISESDTRELIDLQLRKAGWTVDSKTLRHSQGSRPQKGRNMAISEWPTSSGPADYVLFIGLTPVAVVEAKKLNVDVAGALTQSRRYSVSYRFDQDQIRPGGPWGHSDFIHLIPFLYSTNGRGYLKQIKTKSGIWFLDARRSTNHSHPLDGWHSPTDLKQILDSDVSAAEKKLRQSSPDYLPLRYYQSDAVNAVEKALEQGQREMLLAMATGTGKTRTCIALCYRLIKAKRFRRILFLVDRTSLGTQASDSLKDLKLENNQTFADIYDVKELGDITPDEDTRFQIATIQGMVKRLLYDNERSTPTVGQYDCIVVDECHRGYNLDQELTDSELTFRDETDYISKYTRVLEYFDAVKIGLTATPAIHTNEIFGGKENLPIYQYSYRQAVLDGYLVDHEPPLQIQTRLAQDGIHWAVNDEVAVYDPRTQQQELFNTPDEINFDVESYNKRVVNENYNRVICEELARHIDPALPGKTLVYCVTDMHADMVVAELKSAFKKQYGQIENHAIEKITGRADKPLQLIRRYKNEKMPSVAVTVDLLTTGIDVPSIVNLVFLRRVKSRILYDQMIGRGTRLCEDLYGKSEDKTCFYIYDCVDMYSTLQTYTDMKPVVTRPNITYSQLIDELQKTTDKEAQQTIVDQIVAKLQRSKRRLHGDRATEFETRSGGTEPDSLVKQIMRSTPQEVADWFADKTALIEFLDSRASGEGQKLYISDDDDMVINVSRGYGKNNQRPKDYLEEFRTYVTSHQDDIAAIKLCATRPQSLTRKSLRELQLQLANEGFDETRLRAAWRETTNTDIAASIIGYIRHAILDTPLMPFEDRVKRAMERVFASQSWTTPQRQWLERIGKQFRENTLVDREALNQGQFRETGGGLNRLNKIFDGKINNVLEQITEEIWAVAA